MCALVGTGELGHETCSLSRHCNYQPMQAWAVYKYPSVYRTKEKKKQKEINLYHFGVVSGWWGF